MIMMSLWIAILSNAAQNCKLFVVNLTVIVSQNTRNSSFITDEQVHLAILVNHSSG